MIEKCLDILDHSSDIPEKEYLSHRCIEKVLNYSTDESLKKAAGLAERLASSMHREAQHASNVSILRAIAGSFSGNLPLAALAISAMDSSILLSSKEEIGRIYLSELAESAADPSNAGEITTDEGHIDIGGVKLEIRPEKKMGFLTADFNGLTAQMA